MKKILIFEDEPAIIEAIKQELTKWQYQVEAISDWEQVLEQVQAFKPELILMDISLPAFDGFYWTQKLREFTKVPIIFISSADLDQNAVRANDRGWRLPGKTLCTWFVGGQDASFI